jgi:hypothetical protein
MSRSLYKEKQKKKKKIRAKRNSMAEKHSKAHLKNTQSNPIIHPALTSRKPNSPEYFHKEKQTPKCSRLQALANGKESKNSHQNYNTKKAQNLRTRNKSHIRNTL